MWRLAAIAVLAAAFAAPAASQEVAGRVIDVDHRTTGLDFQTRDLVLPDSGVGGAAVSLVVAETDAEIRIELSADILFDFDRSDIKDTAAASLSEVAALVRDHPDRPVRIEGHTDSKGSDAYNMTLSEQRAQSVADWLNEEEGIDDSTFVITGFGESRPVTANEKPDGSDDPEGRQKNRRVEIVIGK